MNVGVVGLAECKEIPNQINEQKQHLEQLRTEVETLAGKYQAQIDNIQAEWDQVAQTIPEKPPFYSQVKGNMTDCKNYEKGRPEESQKGF